MTSDDSPFSAVLLAAGEGARLGRVPKSLLRLDGVSLIEGQLRALFGAGATQIIIVTGYFYLEVEAELEKIMSQSDDEMKSRLLIVRNPAPEKGQQSSVLLGLGASYNHGDGKGEGKGRNNQNPTLIALVDQPLMRAADYRSCIQAFHQRPSGCSIVYPVVGEQRGNPVAFSKDSVHNILQSGLTCREYIDRHRDQVYRFTTDNDHFIVDIDQEQDRLRVEARTGLILTLPPA